MRFREIGLIVLLFGALILFTIFGPARSDTSELGQRGSTHGVDEQGALALRRWLETAGYTANALEYTAWRIPDEADVLWIIAPTAEPILDDEAQEILRWVRDGGTLIAVEERPQLAFAPNALWRLLAVTTTFSDTDDAAPAEYALPVQPVLFDPPVEQVPVYTTSALSASDPSYVPILETRYGPTFIGRQEGRGYVYLGVSADPFTNDGLRQDDSAAFVLNLLARAPRGATVLFDEYHHGFGETAAVAGPSLRQLLTSNWWGWALLYAIGVTALYVVLTGRRFGRPVPLARDIARRSSAEYVQSMAQLLRRGGKRRPIGRHFHEAFKRRLARPFGFVPPDGDEAFVRELLRLGAATDEQAAAVRGVLEGLSRPQIKDVDLIRLVRAADTLVDARGRLR